ncbi:hypothetical protein H9P43_004101 [Blastocladiella emersonii ATCC 22665]|nr:hypothetical protein H9P43_004101 [Blastocladiella emersonii ATCC 22665]
MNPKGKRQNAARNDGGGGGGGGGRGGGGGGGRRGRSHSHRHSNHRNKATATDGADVEDSMMAENQREHEHRPQHHKPIPQRQQQQHPPEPSRSKSPRAVHRADADQHRDRDRAGGNAGRGGGPRTALAPNASRVPDRPFNVNAPAWRPGGGNAAPAPAQQQPAPASRPATPAAPAVAHPPAPMAPGMLPWANYNPYHQAVYIPPPVYGANDHMPPPAAYGAAGAPMMHHYPPPAMAPVAHPHPTAAPTTAAAVDLSADWVSAHLQHLQAAHVPDMPNYHYATTAPGKHGLPPQFVCTLTVGQTTARSRPHPNKRDAKHEAAAVWLAQWAGYDTSVAPADASAGAAAAAANEVQNPVAMLNSLTQDNKWEPVTYTYHSTKNGFSCTVTIPEANLELRTGAHSSKKAAKADAAALALDALNGVGSGASQQLQPQQLAPQQPNSDAASVRLTPATDAYDDDDDDEYEENNFESDAEMDMDEEASDLASVPDTDPADDDDLTGVLVDLSNASLESATTSVTTTGDALDIVHVQPPYRHAAAVPHAPPAPEAGHPPLPASPHAFLQGMAFYLNLPFDARAAGDGSGEHVARLGGVGARGATQGDACARLVEMVARRLALPADEEDEEEIVDDL